LKTYLETKRFIPRNELQIHNNDRRIETINLFNNIKKTKNNDIEKELYVILEENLISVDKQIYNENEQRRDHFLTDAVEECSSLYENNMSEKLDSTFVESFILDEMLRKEKKGINNKLLEYFGDEDKNLFAPYSLKVSFDSVIIIFVLISNDSLVFIVDKIH